MTAIKVQGRGQITLPRSVREAVGMRPGDTLVVEVIEPDQIRLTVLPRLSLAEIVQRYQIVDPIDFKTSREEGQLAAADEALKTFNE